MFSMLAAWAVLPMQDGRNAIAGGGTLDLAAEAKPEKARQLRMCFQHWLRALGAPRALVEDLCLAAYEALTNVVDHAYHPGHPDPDHVVAGPRRPRPTDGYRQ